MTNKRDSIKEVKYKRAFLIVLLAVVLSFCVCVGSVLAWLQDEEIRNSNGLTLGSVDFEIYSGNTRLTSIKDTSTGIVNVSSTTEFVIPADETTTIRNVDLKIRNSGSVHAIIRVTMEVYFKDDDGNRVITVIADSVTQDYHININNSGWVNDFKDSAASGYTYYNSQIAPYNVSTLRTNADGTTTVVSQDVTANAVSVLTQLLVPESMKSKDYFVQLQVDGVAYSGNIYQEMQHAEADRDIPVAAYPFGHPSGLPVDWHAWE